MTPKHRPALLPLAACLLLALAGPAAAYDTWLRPERAAPKAREAVTLDMTSGRAFPTDDIAIMPSRVEKAACRMGDKTTAVESRRPSPNALLLGTSLPKAGVAVCWASLFPKLTELTPDVVQEYLDEIAAPPAVREAWMAGGKPGRWRELYTKHVKTFLRVGEAPTAAGDSSWSTPVGTGLEIVPESDPTTLHANAELGLRLLFQGKPLPGVEIGLVRAGEQGAGYLPATDGEGRSRFRIGAPGLYLIRATWLRKSKTHDFDWESDFATLTFEAK
jgi:hypothetical protein